MSNKRNYLLWLLWLSLFVSSAWAQDTGIKGVAAWPRGAVTCKSLGCEAIDPAVAGTYDLATGQDNATRIENYLNGMKAGKRLCLIVDDQYAIADYNTDDVDITFPGIQGGAIFTPGKSPTPFITGTVDLGDNLGGGFFHVGDDGDCMIEYHGAGADLDLKLVGGVWSTYNGAGSMTEDKAAGHTAGTLIRFLNYSGAVNDPRGADCLLNLMLYVGEVGVEYPSPTDYPGAFYADTQHIQYITFRELDTAYKIDNSQSAQHLIDFIEHDGSLCNYMFDILQGGDVHVVEAYHPNGVLCHFGPLQGFNTSNFVCTNFKCDDNFVEPNRDRIKLFVNDSKDGVIRFRAGGEYGTDPPFDFPIIDTVQTVGSSQPDIQLDGIKGMNPVEASAYPVRPTRNASGWKSQTDTYPTRAFASTKLWIDPTDEAVTNAGVPVFNGENVTVIADKSAADNDIIEGVAIPLEKNGINHQRSLNPISGETSHYLIKESPTDLGTTVGDFTLMAVVMARQFSTTAQYGSIYQCANNTSNPPLRDGVELYVGHDDDDGKIYCEIEDGLISSTVDIEPWKPTLVTVTRLKSSGKCFMRFYGNNTRDDGAVPAATTDLTTLATTPTLVIGSQRYGGTTYQRPFQGWIGQVFWDDATLCTIFDGVSGSTGTCTSSVVNPVTDGTDPVGTYDVINVSGSYDVTSADVGRRLELDTVTGWRKGIYTIIAVTAASDTFVVNVDCSSTSNPTGMKGCLETEDYTERVDYCRAAFGVW